MVLDNDTTAGVAQDHHKSTRSSQSQQQCHYFVTQSVASNDAITYIGQLASRAANALLVPIVTAEAEKGVSVAYDTSSSSWMTELMEDDAGDPAMVVEYEDEIFSYMRELETKMIPDKHYMDHQGELQWSMRSILLEWIVQVHERLSLVPETLFLCVNYIDRFLSCKTISVGKLQLVGATAIFIAAKYEESSPPSVGDIVHMVDDGYTVDEILKAERFMLSMLQFELGWPGPMSFLRRISKANNYDLKTRTLAKYFLEVTIMDERVVGTKPSIIAAAAYFLANAMVNNSGWTPAHVYCSGYTQSQLEPLATMIIECCENSKGHHPVIFRKYASRHYKQASIYVQEIIDGGFTLPIIQPPIRHQTPPEKKRLEVFAADEKDQNHKSIVQGQSLEHIISIFPALVMSSLRRCYNASKD